MHLFVGPTPSGRWYSATSLKKARAMARQMSRSMGRSVEIRERGSYPDWKGKLVEKVMSKVVSRQPKPARVVVALFKQRGFFEVVVYGPKKTTPYFKTQTIRRFKEKGKATTYFTLLRRSTPAWMATFMNLSTKKTPGQAESAILAEMRKGKK